MAENRYRRKERMRRQFTVTKTKAIVGFLLSLLFSLILSPAFDKVAKLFYYRSKEPSQVSAKQDEAKNLSEKSDSKEVGSSVERLKRISEQAGKKKVK